MEKNHEPSSAFFDEECVFLGTEEGLRQKLSEVFHALGRANYSLKFYLRHLKGDSKKQLKQFSDQVDDIHIELWNTFENGKLISSDDLLFSKPIRY